MTMQSHYGERSWTHLALLTVFGTLACAEEPLVIYEKNGEPLTAIPSDIPLNATTVILGKNDITEIPSYAFSGHRFLTHLAITENKLTHIAPEAFVGCPVNKLELRQNKLDVEGLAGVISLNQTLRSLDLRYNYVDYSHTLWFEILQRLGVLEDLHIGGRERPKNLSQVFPLNTRLQLRKLSISYSLLNTIDKQFFSDMYNLESLDFSHNELATFPDLSLLPENNSLKELTLYDNKISLVTRKLLENTPKLTLLALRNNKLYSCPDLRDTGLQFLDLSRNALVCGSMIAWMKQLQDGPDTLTLRLDSEPCTKPSFLVGVPWKSITYADLNEDTDVLLDVDNSTCISLSGGSKRYFDKVRLPTFATFAKVKIIGKNLTCWLENENRGLQFFVKRRESSVAGNDCSSGSLLKRCAVILSDPRVCQYGCDCPRESTGCHEGRLFWDEPCSSSDEKCIICEVEIV